MNHSLTIYAIDDGYFPLDKRKHNYTLIVTVKFLVHPNEKVIIFNDILVERVKIDSLEVTEKIEKMLEAYGPSPDDIVLLDGITYAGFSVVDLKRIRKITKKIIVFFYRPLDLEKIKNALIKNFHDWKLRYNIIENVYSNSIIVEINNITARIYSTFDIMETKSVLERIILFSPIPEPLRIAHIIASTLSKKTIYKNK